MNGNRQSTFILRGKIMHPSIEQTWRQYCNELLETARRRLPRKGETDDQEFAALHALTGASSPKTSKELKQRIEEVNRLIANWPPRVAPANPDDRSVANPGMAYTESRNHESMPRPTESMAEQAEQARTGSSSAAPGDRVAD
jgi:hypothetical protein